MLTPQEVSDKAFTRATFGGYTMTQVDEFLDVLTADYGVLYSENAVLKSKMKVLVDTVEEYRSTEDAMRKALMSAQKIADDLIHNAEEQRNATLAEAEEMARAQVDAIREERAIEERRLAEAQRTVVEFTAQARATYQRNVELLEQLAESCPPAAPQEETVADEIEESVQRILDQAMADVAAAQERAQEEELQEEVQEEATEDEGSELDLNDLEFGKDYQLK